MLGLFNTVAQINASLPLKGVGRSILSNQNVIILGIHKCCSKNQDGLGSFQHMLLDGITFTQSFGTVNV